MPYISKRSISIDPIFSNDLEKSSPIIISQSLYHYLKVLKDSIDDVQNDWNMYKRYTNPYESIHTHNFGNNNQPVCPIRPISRSYFKMIEICNTFELLNSMPQNMKSFHIAEGPGGFIEALSSLRSNPDDDYVGITLVSDEGNVPGWKKTQSFLEKNPNVFVEVGEDGTGDITKYRNLLYCSKKYGASIDLVTADGGFDFSIDYNTQENQMGELLISQLALATAVQKQGGTFILKMFDIFTKVSVDILFLLCVMYDKVQIIKPNTSRYANSERYVVSQGFRSIDGRCDWTIQFAPIFELFGKSIHFNVLSLLREEIPKYFLNKVEESNSSFGQQQIDTISNTLVLIKNPRQDRMEKMRLTNIQKCVSWCQKHKLPYNRDIRHFNMFLSAKNKVSRVPRKKTDSDNETLSSPELIPANDEINLLDVSVPVDDTDEKRQENYEKKLAETIENIVKNIVTRVEED
jgi:23S rRNA U2552 (ribose-2'-O)-methylase RlmE/FtsJ